MINTFEKAGLTHIILENENIKVVFLPEIGGKMIELFNKETGTQFLLKPKPEYGDYKMPIYGDIFENYDASGFDECFPNISQSKYYSLSEENEDYDIILPDHGELWCRPWEYKISGDVLELSIHGKKINYYFKKRIKVNANKLEIDYYLENRSSKKFTYLWCAHPLLNISIDSEIILPEEIDKVFLNWGSDASIGKFGDVLDWPSLYSENGKIDFSRILSKDTMQAMKCFSNRIKHGYAGYYDINLDESVLIEFNPDENPFLGIWLCYRGWPENGKTKAYTIALEPCNGRPDSLKEAVSRGECSEIRVGIEKKWTLKMSLWKGKQVIPSL